MQKLLENHVKTLLLEQFFQIFKLGNIFENFKQCQKSDFWEKIVFFFTFFGQNFRKYCLIQKFEDKKMLLEWCLNMIFKQF